MSSLSYLIKYAEDDTPNINAGGNNPMHPYPRIQNFAEFIRKLYGTQGSSLSTAARGLTGAAIGGLAGSLFDRPGMGALVGAGLGLIPDIMHYAPKVINYAKDWFSGFGNDEGTTTPSTTTPTTNKPTTTPTTESGVTKSSSYMWKYAKDSEEDEEAIDPSILAQLLQPGAGTAVRGIGGAGIGYLVGDSLNDNGYLGAGIGGLVGLTPEIIKYTPMLYNKIKGLFSGSAPVESDTPFADALEKKLNYIKREGKATAKILQREGSAAADIIERKGRAAADIIERKGRATAKSIDKAMKEHPRAVNTAVNTASYGALGSVLGAMSKARRGGVKGALIGGGAGALTSILGLN